VESEAQYTYTLQRVGAPPSYIRKPDVFQPFTVPGGGTGSFTVTIKTGLLYDGDPMVATIALIIHESSSEELVYGPIGIVGNDVVSSSLAYDSHSGKWAVNDFSGGKACVTMNLLDLLSMRATPFLTVPDGDELDFLVDKLISYEKGTVPSAHPSGVG
jgi:hypothetical protein